MYPTKPQKPVVRYQKIQNIVNRLIDQFDHLFSVVSV